MVGWLAEYRADLMLFVLSRNAAMASKLHSNPPERHMADSKLLRILQSTMSFLATNMCVGVLIALVLDFLYPKQTHSSSKGVLLSYSEWAAAHARQGEPTMLTFFLYAALQLAIIQNVWLGRGLFVWR